MRTRGNLLLMGLGLVLFFGLALPMWAQTGNTWYVSRLGSNGDGRGWATAWREFNQINWSQIQAGDTIVVDGGGTPCVATGVEGSACGMTYDTPLVIGVSGVTIRLASDFGRNGTAILDGGLKTFTSCSTYPPEPAPPVSLAGGTPRGTGVNYNGRSNVVLDGTKWGGIVIRNHTGYGINLAGGSSNVVRFVKIHHITDPGDTSNNAAGINQGYTANGDLVELVEIFRIGQDGMKVAGDNLTVRNSYIHDLYCNHPDGIQAMVYTNNGDIPDNAGEISGMVIENNVFERIALQGMILGNIAVHDSWLVNTVIRDNLFIGGQYAVKSSHPRSTRWVVENNTFVGGTQFAVEWCCGGASGPMTVRNNVFYQIVPNGSAFYFPTTGSATAFENNCLYQTGRRTGNYVESGTINANPQFVEAGNHNYALAAGSLCAGKGSRYVTSLSQLYQLGLPVATPTATIFLPTVTNAPTLTETLMPTEEPTATPIPPTAEPTATPVPPTWTATVTPEPPPGDLPTPTMRANYVWDGTCYVLYNAAGEAIDIESCRQP